MISSSAVVLAALVQTAPLLPESAEVELYRQFTGGQRLSYTVDSTLVQETRQVGLLTFMPSSFGLKYAFTMDVTALKADGFAQILYRRPTMTQVFGETAEAPPVEEVEKTDWRLELTLSPINEVTGIKDLNPPPPARTGGESLAREWAAYRTALRLRAVGIAPSAFGFRQESPFAQFIGELQRMALFVGNLDSALDLSPRLPFDTVKVGDTWKKTVSYQPQRLSGQDRTAVQRLDYTFTYEGVKPDRDGKDVHRITATLQLDTDAAPYVNDLMRMKPSESGLKSVKLKLDATIAFDLDLQTKNTVRAVANSKGGFSIETTDRLPQPVVEQRLTGESRLRLQSIGNIP